MTLLLIKFLKKGDGHMKKEKQFFIFIVTLFSSLYGPSSWASFKDAKFELGRALFFDKILSGNKNIFRC